MVVAWLRSSGAERELWWWCLQSSLSPSRCRCHSKLMSYNEKTFRNRSSRNRVLETKRKLAAAASPAKGEKEGARAEGEKATGVSGEFQRTKGGKMPYTRLVEVGRVAMINYGKDYGKLVVIVDIVDAARVSESSRETPRKDWAGVLARERRWRGDLRASIARRDGERSGRWPSRLPAGDSSSPSPRKDGTRSVSCVAGTPPHPGKTRRRHRRRRRPSGQSRTSEIPPSPSARLTETERHRERERKKRTRERACESVRRESVRLCQLRCVLTFHTCFRLVPSGSLRRSRHG